MEEQDDKRQTDVVPVPLVDDDPMLGLDVGGYVIDGELGRGGMGVVYAATHPMIGKRAAIKVLKSSLSNNPATVERFLQEARSVNQIGHPNIVDIFAFGSLPDGRHYLVMDLLQGESLRARVRRGCLHVREAATVLDEIASALAAAHGKGFVHRDLKPDNVFLVSHPGRVDVKLLDFGLAKLLPQAINMRAYRTATGVQLGTPDYMSPEQHRGEKEVDTRTDIYALGVVAFEMLTGKRPRRLSENMFDLGGKTVAETLAFVPGEIAQLVETMLASNANDRPSLVAVRTVLKRVMPTLPPLSVVGAPIAFGTAPAMDSMSASQLGAGPVVPTPHPRSLDTVVSAADAAFDEASLDRPARPVSEMPLAVEPAQPDRSGGDPPRLQAVTSSPALRVAPSIHSSTTLGVPPPPPRASRSQVAAARRSRENHAWLIVGAVLVLAAGIALVIVIAT